jgi:hypothetical protein
VKFQEYQQLYCQVKIKVIGRKILTIKPPEYLLRWFYLVEKLSFTSFKTLKAFKIAGVSWVEGERSNFSTTPSTAPGTAKFLFFAGSYRRSIKPIIGWHRFTGQSGVFGNIVWHFSSWRGYICRCWGTGFIIILAPTISASKSSFTSRLKG